ncbi:hypothetical protein GCK32_015427 [Trichostrongylus colubriformis]|uniref:Uncharacterized protein n=1 Tax=Trichostrongylus colubriformis TaxID=6319 RepID=A0AAN8G7T3_TRICO
MNLSWLDFIPNKMANRGEAPFPEFILEREFQCHNTLLIRDVVCKTIQKFVKKPQDVRLSITVAFQPRTTAKIASHEHDAIAIIEVDKPGNFYPGGQEQRWRNRELEVLKKVEEDKAKERREMHKAMFNNNEDKTKQKTDLGVKRPPSTTTGKAGKTPPASPTRRSPLPGSPVNMDEDKPVYYGPRRPCTEEMVRVSKSL